jgi:hypothetical protein
MSLAYGSRVWVQMFGRRVLILGMATGAGVTVPDFGVEAAWPIEDHSVSPADRWRVASTSGADVAGYRDTDPTRVHSGAQSLRLHVGTTGQGISIYSPTVAVEEGKTYAFSVWMSKSNATVAKSYVRVAGGSTDALAEYTAAAPGNEIPVISGGATWENVDLPLYTAVWKKVTLVVTIPAGVTRAALRIFNWSAAAPLALYADDMEVKEITDPTLVTGWMPATLNNSWINYGTPYQQAEYRRVGDEVQVRGLIKSGSSGVSVLTLPVGFRPPAEMLYAGIANLNYTWATGPASAGTAHTHSQGNPPNNALRLNVQPNGNITVNSGTPNGYIDLSMVRFSVTP